MGKSFGTSGLDGNVKGIYIRPDGTQAFISGDTNNKVFRLALSTAWDISTASDDSNSVTLTSNTGPSHLFFKSDGTKFWITNEATTTMTVQQYSMSTAWDLTTATADGSCDLTAQVANARGFFFSDDGTKLYAISSTTYTVYQYSLTTAWDVTGTVTYDSASLSLSAQGTFPAAAYMRSGNQQFIVNQTFAKACRYSMSVAKDLTTAAFDTGQTFTFTEDAGNDYGIYFKPDGTEMYVVGIVADNIYQYTLATAWDVTSAAFNPPPTADGAVDITANITAAGTSSVLPIHTNAGIVLTGNISAAGTATIQRTTLNGTVDITSNIVVAGTSRTTIHAAGAVDITGNITAEGTGFVAVIAELTLPALTSTGTLAAAPSATLTLPSMSATGTMDTGRVITASVTLPLPQVQAFDGVSASLTLPALTATATGYPSNVYDGSVVFPTLTVTASVSNDRTLTAAVTMPAAKVQATAVHVQPITANLTLHALEVTAQGAAGTTVVAVLEAPIFEATATLTTPGTATAALTIPALYVESIVTVLFTQLSAWAVNTENIRTTEYNNYEFLFVGKVFGRYIGVTTSGVFELTGATDNSANIDASVLFGLDSFRTEDLKRIKAVYLGYRADGSGELVVQISIDGEPAVREYAVKKVSNANGIKRGRATIAKGLKSRYWQYGVKNVNGADFMIDDLSIFVQQHNRKVQ